MSQCLLAVNSGSSSVKVGLFRADPDVTRMSAVIAEGIGGTTGRVKIQHGNGAIVTQSALLPDHSTAVQAIVDWVKSDEFSSEIMGIGHRFVHGGDQYRESCYLVDDAMADRLAALVSLAPEHLPQAIAAMNALGDAFPTVPQAACFDTAFHSTLSPLARQYPLPGRPEFGDIVRYGFHGLSCESVHYQLQVIDATAARGRVIIAHLGNGSSMTALRNGQSVDTTMGFTPAGGLMMGTRTGDLDPGALLYLFTKKGMTADQVQKLVNHESGLLGISGQTSDMRTLLECASTDERALNAIELYCYLARKHLGSLIAVLGGVETLVFTGGVGENASEIRRVICQELAFLGIELDINRNNRHESIISSEQFPVTVRIVATDEERMIARHTIRLLQGEDYALSV